MDWFPSQLLAWFDAHGRRNLPWQQDRTPYRVWVSEIMLQQTQVTTVIPYFEKFIAHFPDVGSLAAAHQDEVLHHWTGLGYYARGRNLHRAAGKVLAEFSGELPPTVELLETLPGVGRSTAGAIAAIAQGVRAPILDGNVKRVLARFHAVSGYPGESKVAKELWAFAEEHTPTRRIADYTQAIMDLGAAVCVRGLPDCQSCPLHEQCQAFATDTVAQYPGRKPKKEKPARAARLFLLHDSAGGCLLEQRPQDGIWGGLWGPPEWPIATSAEDFLRHVGLSVDQTLHTHTGNGFRHTFSHFHLDIEPIYIAVRTRPSIIRDQDSFRWYQSGANELLGLSAPAVKLLSSLHEFNLT
jgi:A/G-specific adenine glycosylase